MFPISVKIKIRFIYGTVLKSFLIRSDSYSCLVFIAKFVLLDNNMVISYLPS